MDIRSAVVLVFTVAACREPERTATTARAALRYDQHLAAGGRLPVGDSLRNPLAGDSTAAAQGEKLFASMNCDGCHGGGATGFAAPSLVDGRWRYGGADGALFHSVYFGRPRGMPAYGNVMSESSIWQVISYLRAQPVPANAPTEAWP